MNKKIFIQLLGTLTLTISIGCQSVPYSNRNRVLLTSEEEEQSTSIEAWAQILKEEKQSNNPVYINAVNRVGRNIANAAKKPEYQWEFKVFESDQANAFCLPGGKIAVYTGLFKYTDNDAELAAVMGHEVGHAIARHGGERMSQGKIYNIGEYLLGLVVEGEYLSKAMMAYGLGAQYGAILPYSRKHEHEADHIGLLLMCQAGYNPSAAFSFWNKFSEASSNSEIAELFSTHPIGVKRIENMKTYVPEAARYYMEATPKHNYGQTYK